MAVRYKVLAKGQPGVKGGGKKQFYAAIVNQDVQGIDKITEAIEAASTVSGADIRAVLYAAVQAINGFLADGDIVRLGDLGSFRLSLSSIGAPAPEAVTATSITGTRILFTPGPMLKTLLATLKFEKEKGAAQAEKPAMPQQKRSRS